MFESTSRYYKLKTAKFNFPNKGEEIVYVQRRFLPQVKDIQILEEIRVNPGDRLDLIAAKKIGNPELFWRICDANAAMNPTELTAQAGQRLLIPLPQL